MKGKGDRTSIAFGRRQLVGSAFAVPFLAGCSARIGQPRSLEGLAIESESVQLSCYSADGLSGFTVRLGRFPSVDISWLWAHVFLPDVLVGFTDDRLPDAVQGVSQGRTNWRLAGPPRLEITRFGLAEGPSKVTLTGSWRGHINPRATHGAGKVPVSLEAGFVPARSTERVLAGRNEAKGTVTARIMIGDRTAVVVGDGHYHEQRQSTPRFTTPFVYLRGSNPDEAFTFIKARSASGSLMTGAGELSITSFDITAPAPRRRFRVGLEDGRTLEGELSQTHQFWLPIFDSARFSQIVTGTLDGRRFVGGVNDWLGDKLEYWRP